MRTIIDVLDRAKQVQKVKSDYKLSLCIGIGESSLSSYRLGKNLPDEINCSKLAQAMGEDPALLTVEMQAQRAKTPEARQIWVSIAQRLQAGFLSVNLLILIAIFSVAMNALPAWAGGVLLLSNTRLNIPTLYIMFSRIVKLCVSRMGKTPTFRVFCNVL